MSPHAVLFGDDEMLNLTRRWILERTGCTVLTAKRPAEVGLLCKEYPIDLLVVCYTLLEKDCALAVEAALEACPKVQTLWLRPHGQPAPASIPQDAQLTSDGPHELFIAARKVVELLHEREDVG